MRYCFDLDKYSTNESKGSDCISYIAEKSQSPELCNKISELPQRDWIKTGSWVGICNTKAYEQIFRQRNIVNKINDKIDFCISSYILPSLEARTKCLNADGFKDDEIHYCMDNFNKDDCQKSAFTPNQKEFCSNLPSLSSDSRSKYCLLQVKHQSFPPLSLCSLVYKNDNAISWCISEKAWEPEEVKLCLNFKDKKDQYYCYYNIIIKDRFDPQGILIDIERNRKQQICNQIVENNLIKLEDQMHDYKLSRECKKYLIR